MTSSPLSHASAVTVDCASESCALAEAAPASEAAVVAPLYTSSRLHKRMMPIWQLAATYLQGRALDSSTGTCCSGAGVQQQARSYRKGSASQSCSSCPSCSPETGSMLGTGSTLCTGMRSLPAVGHWSRVRQPSGRSKLSHRSDMAAARKGACRPSPMGRASTRRQDHECAAHTRVVPSADALANRAVLALPSSRDCRNAAGQAFRCGCCCSADAPPAQAAVRLQRGCHGSF